MRSTWPLTGPSGMLRLKCRGLGPLSHHVLDPTVGSSETFLERDLRLPGEHLTQAGVVAVAAADALRRRQIVPSPDLFPGDAGHHIHQLIDADQAVLAEIQRLPKVRLHQAIDALDAIVDIAVGASLLAVTPHLDL